MSELTAKSPDEADDIAAGRPFNVGRYRFVVDHTIDGSAGAIDGHVFPMLAQRHSTHCGYYGSSMKVAPCPCRFHLALYRAEPQYKGPFLQKGYDRLALFELRRIG